MIGVLLSRLGKGRALALVAVLAVPVLSASARPDASWDLPFFFDLHTFRGDEGATTVVAAVAVPVRGLRRERHSGSYRYRFDVRFVLADTARQSVAERIDSVFVTLPGVLGRDHLLHTVLEVEAVPSDHTIQRLVVTDASRPGIGEMHDGPTNHRSIGHAPALHDVDDRSSLFDRMLPHRLLGVEPGYSERHHGDGGEFRESVQESGQGVVKMVGVVHPGAHHHLRAHLDVVVEKRSKPPEAHRASAVL